MEDLVARGTCPAALDVRGIRVLVTGHTGFKGAWLCEWLLHAGAQVFGIALPPEPSAPLFSALRLADRLSRNAFCDIRDHARLAEIIRQMDPHFIFHLAAQALVRRSYRDPLQTWQTNVDGTLSVLEAARMLEHPVTVVVVTTDKVYRNREWEFAYREEDELGGHDPYSASKAACEIAVASWRSSFGSTSGATVVTARAGNVLGAGDFSEDRIIPDCFRAWNAGKVVQIRKPASTRPWQHVLEPLSGYLALAAHASSPRTLLHACNFGPGPDGDRTVEELVRAFAALGRNRQWSATSASEELHEARSLSLSIDRARQVLGWRPRLSFEETVAWTNDGYGVKPSEFHALIAGQIAAFEAKKGVPVRVSV